MKAKSKSSFVPMSKRAGGVLLAVSSLPGPFGIGDLGPTAREWVDLLADARQRWWQILPLGYTAEDGSPYRCYSAFAGNPLLISPQELLNEGLLEQKDLVSAHLPGAKVDYPYVTQNKINLLRIAHERFKNKSSHRLNRSYKKFLKQERHWLEDFALFMALRSAQGVASWTQWPAPILRRASAALIEARSRLADAYEFHRFTQFIFSNQLQSLRDYASAKQVAVLGDLPIFVSPESSDVWANPRLFQLDRNLQPVCVSGVPPDLFSKTGQRWGNPLYNWKKMAQDNFAWWKARLDAALRQADLVRIDHFRGLESCWSIPADCPTAQRGKWVKVPGVELFKALMEDNSNLPLVAEDLGVITPEVEALRDRFNLPGMRVLQFGFSGQPGDLHTPHNFIRHCFAYTGTHDNDTTAGWYKTLRGDAKRRLKAYAPQLGWNEEPAWCLTQLLWASSGGHAVVPVQDLLNLGSEARMNVPGQADHNWEWRLTNLADLKKPMARLARFSIDFERTV